jgi:hypothetical protein
MGEHVRALVGRVERLLEVGVLEVVQVALEVDAARVAVGIAVLNPGLVVVHAVRRGVGKVDDPAARRIAEVPFETARETTKPERDVFGGVDVRGLAVRPENDRGVLGERHEGRGSSDIELILIRIGHERHFDLAIELGLGNLFAHVRTNDGALITHGFRGVDEESNLGLHAMLDSVGGCTDSFSNP